VRRRAFLVVLLGAAGLPSAGLAQFGPSRRLGVLATTRESDPEWKAEIGAFREGLTALGWTEGQNLVVEYSFGMGDVDRLAAGAKQLVSRKPDLLVARSTRAAKALLGETTTIPIVFVSAADPVGENLATSIARPGGNATGFTNVEASMGGKWLELLAEIAPRARRVAVLYNANAAVRRGDLFMPPMERAAAAAGISIEPAQLETPADIERVIASFAARGGDGALVVPPDLFIVANRTAIIQTAARYGLPAIYSFRNMATEGGLMSYGVDVADLYRRSAEYVDRILRGARPGDLPIQGPAGFELVLNLRTAQALGLTVSPSLLARANEVID
jgi:putative ABC transport system substrate-binding protein